MSLAILVPVLRRPQNVAPLLASIEATTPDARVVFICDEDDHAERHAVKAAGLKPLVITGGYAEKITAGVAATDEPLIFTAADDLRFHPGWYDKAHARLSGTVKVVGVNDFCTLRVRQGTHATHFLMTREYAETPTIDGGPGPFCHLYDHSFCDDEFVATAQARGVIAFARDSVVEHLHHLNGKALDDETYRKGRERFDFDRNIFRSRGELWTARSA